MLTSAFLQLPSFLWSSTKGWHSFIMKGECSRLDTRHHHGIATANASRWDTGAYVSGNKGVGVLVISHSIQSSQGSWFKAPFRTVFMDAMHQEAVTVNQGTC